MATGAHMRGKLLGAAAATMKERAGQFVRGGARSGAGGLGGRDGKGQTHDKLRPVAVGPRRTEGEIAAVGADDIARKAQPEANARGGVAGAGAVAAEETLEHVRSIFG